MTSVAPPSPVEATTDGGVRLPTPTTLGALVDELGGVIDDGARGRVIETVTTPSCATDQSLVPVLRSSAVSAQVGALLVIPDLASRVPPERRWVHPFARWALALVLQKAVVVRGARVSPSAIIEPGASVGLGVDIGPGAVICEHATIGDGCVIGPRAVIYGGVRLGRRVMVGAGAVIGRPGFGWAHGPDGQVVRVPHLAGVEIGDDVEVGALVTVDAGTLQPTRLRSGCKLDAHVHVGHNVDVGSGTMVAAQSGFAGSAVLGRQVLVGGQVGVADHVVVGDGARLAGGAGVIGNVPAGTTVAGYPAVERVRWLRAIAKLMRGRSS